jgi:hypothetical protein
MGLLSCQRISRVLTRIGGREGGQRRVDREKRKETEGQRRQEAQALSLNWTRGTSRGLLTVTVNYTIPYSTGPTAVLPLPSPPRISPQYPSSLSAVSSSDTSTQPVHPPESAEAKISQHSFPDRAGPVARRGRGGRPYLDDLIQPFLIYHGPLNPICASL